MLTIELSAREWDAALAKLGPRLNCEDVAELRDVMRQLEQRGALRLERLDHAVAAHLIGIAGGGAARFSAAGGARAATSRPIEAMVYGASP